MFNFQRLWAYEEAEYRRYVEHGRRRDAATVIGVLIAALVILFFLPAYAGDGDPGSRAAGSGAYGTGTSTSNGYYINGNGYWVDNSGKRLAAGTRLESFWQNLYDLFTGKYASQPHIAPPAPYNTPGWSWHAPGSRDVVGTSCYCGTTTHPEWRGY